jgi:hypothetical protein
LVVGVPIPFIVMLNYLYINRRLASHFSLFSRYWKFILNSSAFCVVAKSRVKFKVAVCIVHPMGDMWPLKKVQDSLQDCFQIYCIEYKYMYIEL